MSKKKFKVRRNALFMRSASVIGTGPTHFDEGLETASGSVSTFKGGLTAASSFLVTGSAIIGASGRAIAGLLAGSATMVFGNIVSGGASVASIAVAGLTTAHKVFIGASDLDPDLSIACVGTVSTGCLFVNVQNTGSTQYTGATEVISYLAILDK